MIRYKFVTDYENTKHYKIKKAVRRDEKLFIGLTTKPATSYKFVANNTTNVKNLMGQKSLSVTKGFPQYCGLDGTRTRDPMRDRHVF